MITKTYYIITIDIIQINRQNGPNRLTWTKWTKFDQIELIGPNRFK